MLNQYKRRADLVPDLVSVGDFERETLAAVIEARSQVGKIEVPEGNLTNPGAFTAFEESTSALSRLLVVVGAIPHPHGHGSLSHIAVTARGDGEPHRCRPP